MSEMGDKPIRVAQVMGKMHGGGVESVVMNYYRHIDHRSVQFDFIVDADSTMIPREEIESHGGRVIEIPPYQKLFAYHREFRKVFANNDYRIVHSHVNTLSVFPLQVAKSAGVPIRIAHSHSTMGKNEMFRNGLKLVLKRLSTKYPTHLFACSDYAGKWLFGENAKYRVLPNAVEATKYRFDQRTGVEVRRELGISRDAFVMGHIGRFMRQKNHEFLIDIFGNIRQSRSDAVLCLAGEGPLRGEIEAKVDSLGLSECVQFLGQRSDAERLYQVFDAFVLPSLYEGLPVVGIEAQMAALPCFFSDQVTKEILLSDQAYSIPLEKSACDWASGILRVCDMSTRKAASDEKRLSGYDIQRAAKNLEGIYLEMFNCCDRTIH